MNDLERVLREATLYTDDQEYVMVHLPTGAVMAAAGVLAETREPFGAVLVDKDEVTLVLQSAVWEAYNYRLPDHRTAGPFRLITFDIPLDMELVGFMATISRTLADAGVSIIALSAYERDHLLVPADRFDTAWQTLQAVQRSAG